MQTVESVIAGLPYKHQPAVQRLRSMILKADPGVVETVKWGTPVYSRGRNLISIVPNPEHVQLKLWEGGLFARRFKCIEGQGKGMRHITVPYQGDFDFDMIANVISAIIKIKKPAAPAKAAPAEKAAAAAAPAKKLAAPAKKAAAAARPGTRAAP